MVKRLQFRWRNSRRSIPTCSMEWSPIKHKGEEVVDQVQNQCSLNKRTDDDDDGDDDDDDDDDDDVL